MFKDKRITVIIPCLNEEKGLEKVLDFIPTFIDEVIVVDNGSFDNSEQIAKRYKARCLTEEKRGYGSAILKGLKHANGKIIAVIDGDASYPIEMLHKICAYMEKDNLDFVSGCRFPLNNSRSMSFANMLSNYFISWLIRFLFKVDIVDSQSGMMVFKKDILNKIEIRNTKMGFSQEIKIKTWLNPDIKCGEIHIPYYPRIGKVKFRRPQDSMMNLCGLLTLWLHFQKRNTKCIESLI